MKRLFLVLMAVALAAECLAQGVKVGPWVCNTRENSVTILWTSEVPGMAFLELEDGTQKYETFAGRRIFGRLHSITLGGLNAGQVVKYRVCGQNLTDGSNARKPKFGDYYKGVWHQVRTLNSKAGSCRFSVFNDIHMRIDKYAALAGQVDSAATDFIFLNGDITSAGNYVLDSAVKYAIQPLGSVANGHPLFFGRGNHEGRGDNVQLFAQIYPNSTPAPFYYTFRQGPVAFIVFDAGETGQERSILFSGGTVYEEYLNDQMEWAREAVLEPEFKDAPVQICILHVPMFDHPDKKDYLIQRWLHHHFTDFLNKAGIDLMIGADIHEFMLYEAGSMGNNYPIIVNDDARRMEVECVQGGPIKIKTFNAEGKMEFSRDFSINRK